jgi:NAD(P)-dependent dehydrogenase (short-subunit alcohol dehydrogenase family)
VLAVAYGGAVEGMARGLAVDLLPIRVNCVAPGAILTKPLDSIPAEKRQSVLEQIEQMSKDTLMGRVGTLADAAEAYIYLMKDGFCTGSLVHSDGGRLLK